MAETWGPTSSGLSFTSTPVWKLTLEGERYAFLLRQQTYRGSVKELQGLTVEPGLIWATVRIPAAGTRAAVKVDGIPNQAAVEMLGAVQRAAKEFQRKQYLRAITDQFEPFAVQVAKWSSSVNAAMEREFKRRGWLGREFLEALEGTTPTFPEEALREPEIAAMLQGQPKAVQASVQRWRRGVQALGADANAKHEEAELLACKEFFSSVEKSALTQEQARAVICFDNRVLLVAAAGSGKTSTMVAKAAFALHKGYFAPNEILLLAFNSDAADELRTRMHARMRPLGLPAEGIEAKTFHAFGLDVIGQATGKKPSVAAWIESGQDLAVIQELVDGLKDQDPLFRMEWDLFRLVLGQDLPKFGKEHLQPESWDREARREGFWTLNNEVVKSRGEQLIANWLFYNGVPYVYEGPYEVDTADPNHRQYRPDFYFPDVNAYLEHWALDERGEPPEAFAGYKEGMAWKRSVHAQNGTVLLETTMAQLWSGQAFAYLSAQLTKLGVALDPNPDREVPGRRPIENPRLARVFRTFLTHTKANRLTAEQLRKRMLSGVAGNFRFRHEVFLRLFNRIWQAWEERLRAQKCIDFDDMLNRAVDCLERGTWKSPFRLVMVDEFQDASHARARLLSALVKEPDRYLFAVGDDWQSINRFAGADLAVMTDFEQIFGKGTTLRLETTFRCSQALCDISSSFVQRNPKQLRKSVRSTNLATDEALRLIQVPSEHQIPPAIQRRLDDLATKASAAGKRRKVFVLGRYNNDRRFVPAEYDDTMLDVEFLTVHSSKGLEADYVVLPRVTSETLGFPSRVADDPVLQLAMPSGDTFEYAEERRLFYVALTRARLNVTLISLEGRDSPFVTELVGDANIPVHQADGSEASATVCPVCQQGFMVRRRGPYGEFLGCSTFPRCKHKVNLASASGQSSSKRRQARRSTQ
jgi:DNA helicase-4